MLVKFFARGTGSGRGPVEYITRRDDPSTGKLRSPAPEVLRGNPVITRRLIDSLEFKHKYRSGVLSFAPRDAPTDKQIEAVIDSFEEYAFAGLDKDAYNTLWVKHTHTGNNRVELHFVTPRVELYTGKSLNIAPPGWHGYFKPWQTNWNIKQGWARPDDPARKRLYEPGFQALINADRKAKGLEPIPDTRKLLTEYVLERVTTGLISDRNGIVKLFQEELGLEITRAGLDYITVLDPETDSRYRLKGKLYEREFRPQPETTAEIRPRTTNSSRFDSKELRQVRARIRSNYQYRYKYHQKRYAASTVNTELDAGQVLANASHGRVEPLSGYLSRQLGDDAILVESDKPETGDIGLSRREDRFRGSRDSTAAKDSGEDTGVYRRSNDYSDRQRNISDSADEFNINSWLAMPGRTLHEIGVDDERTRKQINDRFVSAVTAIQAGHDESVWQIQHGHESVVGAEQAASNSSDGLEQASQELERANREALRIQQQTNLNLSRVRGALKKRLVKQLERFKTEINLVEYAISIGYEYVKAKSRHNKAMLRHESGDKIVVVTDTNRRGIYFSLKDNKDNGTIIDFVQHRQRKNLGEVRKELRPWLVKGDLAVVGDVAKPQPMSEDRISLIQEFSNFSVLKSHPSLAKLGISESTLNSDRFIGRIAIDNKNNLVFPHYDHDGITGYESKNDGKNSFSRSGTKALWQSNSHSEDTRLVITAHVIDALSYHQLFPHRSYRYIAIGSTPSSYQRELIAEAMTLLNHPGAQIIIATGNDEAGEQLADTITSLVLNSTQLVRHKPENAESWNKVLQRQIDFTKSSVQASEVQRPKQKKLSQLQP